MTSPLMHYFDPSTFIYLHSENAVRDSFDECWVVPSNATLAPIQKAAKGFINVWNPKAKTWALKPDFRELTYYQKTDGEAVEIKEVGEIPATLTASQRPSIWHHFNDETNQWMLDKVEQLTDLKAAARDKINRLRDQFEISIFMFEGVAIDCDTISRQRLADACITAQSAMLSGLGIPKQITWTCADNSQIELDVKGLLSMQAEFTKHLEHCHVWAKDLKNKVDGAKTEAAINAILEGLSYE